MYGMQDKEERIKLGKEPERMRNPGRALSATPRIIKGQKAIKLSPETRKNTSETSGAS